MASQNNPLQSLLSGQSKYPVKLTNLYTTLLSQSRLRAPHLKAEEEVARTHACAEIACRRLRAQLRLPPTKDGTAPCKPVVYKKLLKFLEGVLGDTTTITPPTGTTATTSASREQPPNVAGKKRKRGDGRSDPQPVEEAQRGSQTPARKKTSKDEFVGTVKSTNTTGKGKGSESPSFVTPAIRTLCRTFSTKQMMPHVYTGTCVVLRLAEIWPRGNDSNDDDEDHFTKTVKDLVIALYLMVLTRMQTGKMTTKIFKATSAKAIEALEVESQSKDIEAWIRRINKKGFCQGQDWWESVPEGVFDFDPDRPSDEDVAMEDVNGEGNGDEDGVAGSRNRSNRRAIDLDVEDPDGVLLVGLGTMMQDAVDFLSEQKTLDYLDWEKDILERIQKTPAGRKAVAQARVAA